MNRVLSLLLLAVAVFGPLPVMAQGQRALAPSQALTLTAAAPRFQTSRVAVDPLTSRITVRLRRPSDPSATVRVALVLVVDGIEYSARGQMSGGPRIDPETGAPLTEYVLSYAPTVSLGVKGRAFMAASKPDARGFYRNVPMTRLGETATTPIESYIKLEWVRGVVDSELLEATAVAAPAPTITTKNSVAFDAVTDGHEVGGDNILSVDHLNSGTTNLAAFAINAHNNASVTTSSLTYGGAAMSQVWSEVGDANKYTSGYVKVSPATGTQTVVSTLSASVARQFLAAHTFTGVNQTTPTGTHQAAFGSGLPPQSVTISDAGDDDMIIGVMNGPLSPIEGADQTRRGDEGISGYGTIVTSTQPGTADDVFSYSWGGGAASHGLAAVAIKATVTASQARRSMHQFRQR